MSLLCPQIRGLFCKKRQRKKYNNTYIFENLNLFTLFCEPFARNWFRKLGQVRAFKDSDCTIGARVRKEKKRKKHVPGAAAFQKWWLRKCPRTVSTDQNVWREDSRIRRNQTEVFLLTNLTPNAFPLGPNRLINLSVTGKCTFNPARLSFCVFCDFFIFISRFYILFSDVGHISRGVSVE